MELIETSQPGKRLSNLIFCVQLHGRILHQWRFSGTAVAIASINNSQINEELNEAKKKLSPVRVLFKLRFWWTNHKNNTYIFNGRVIKNLRIHCAAILAHKLWLIDEWAMKMENNKRFYMLNASTVVWYFIYVARHTKRSPLVLLSLLPVQNASQSNCLGNSSLRHGRQLKNCCLNPSRSRTSRRVSVFVTC